MRQFSASAAFTAIATASRFSTGSAPGRPRQTGQVLVFGGAPNLVEQPQKILERVRSWTCTSSPITGSYFLSSSSWFSSSVFAVAIGCHSLGVRSSCQAEPFDGACPERSRGAQDRFREGPAFYVEFRPLTSEYRF